MPWFRIDDCFDSHPKVLEAGNAAVGLFVRCGAYSSRHTLDGFIPSDIASLYGTKNAIKRLLSTGLWVQVVGGYSMPDFLEYNPSAEQVKAQREAAAERQRHARERARLTRESQRESRVTRGVSHAPPRHGPPDPTRPLNGLHPLTTSEGGAADMTGPMRADAEVVEILNSRKKAQ